MKEMREGKKVKLDTCANVIVGALSRSCLAFQLVVGYLEAPSEHESFSSKDQMKFTLTALSCSHHRSIDRCDAHCRASIDTTYTMKS